MAKDAKGHGRNAKIDDDVVGRICQAVRTGVAMDSAAEYAGVPRQTFFDWLRKGRQPRAQKIYRDLVEQVEKAVADFEVLAMARITKAGEEAWQADAWRLERKFPERYGRRTRIDGQVSVQAVPFIDLDKLTAAEAQTLLRLLRKASPAQEQLPAEGRPALELLPGALSDEA